MLLGLVASIVIRAPHETRSKETKVAENRRGALEVSLLVLMMLGTLVLPLVSMATSLLAFADYPLSPVQLALAGVTIVFGLWLFHRSHVDLGKNWSITLQVREGHTLVTGGVYARIRHPMYTALFALALGQALALPNWIAGPAMLEAFTLMFVLRLGPEEKMMLDRFGPEYEAYRARTKRLIPGVF
jgi:protein-S-isoprenylcysteine O-methyltransferase Ste14